MRLHKQTSFKEFDGKDKENPKAPVSTNLTLSIWEYAYTLEKKAFKDLVRRKAKRLHPMHKLLHIFCRLQHRLCNYRDEKHV